MRVLGIDPGSRYTGFGIVEGQGGRLVHVVHGVIRAGSSDPLENRLDQIFHQLGGVIARFRPEAVAVEGLFSFKNARSALILGHARGVALLAAARVGVSVHEYPPARVKKSVGARGAGGKDQVARMVSRLLGIDEIPRADATDALAVAICHLHQARGPGVLRRSGAARRKVGFASLGERLSPAVVRFG